jgi:hypothetical protein
VTDLDDIQQELYLGNQIGRRIADALERIADAFAPASAAINAPPAQPEVGGVQIAED